MSTELVNALRRIAKVSYGASIEEARSVSKTQRYAADLIEQQAARIAELEARAGEAVAWLYDVKITKHVQTHRNDRYYSLDGGETFVQGQPLYTNPPTGDAAGKDSVDAARYRWLREQHWNEADMAVVCEPKKSVKLGFDCPSGERLDEAIDSAIASSTRQCMRDAYCAAIASLTKTADGEKDA